MPKRPGNVDPSRPSVSACIGLGSNQGDRLGYLQFAVEGLIRHPRIWNVEVSSVYGSEAHTMEEGEDAPEFRNAVVLCETSLPAEELLAALQAFEAAAGRERDERWAPRTLDLDILLYGDRTIQTPHLIVPHPRMGDRLFVLRPLNELAPSRSIPGDGTVEEVASSCPDSTDVWKTDEVLNVKAARSS